MKRIKKVILTLFVLIMMLCLFTGCDKCDEFNFHIPTFEEKCVTTEDGFVYYPIENEAYIIKIPETEEVTIPEYIDGKKVVQLGYEDQGLGYVKKYTVLGGNTKKLVISNPIIFYSASFNLDILVYIDFLHVISDINNEQIKIENIVGNHFHGQEQDTLVQLLRSERELALSNSIRIIEIPKYVTVIEDGVFDGLEDVTIKTSYESKPDGWEDGWNGTCAVEWGVDI